MERTTLNAFDPHYKGHGNGNQRLSKLHRTWYRTLLVGLFALFGLPELLAQLQQTFLANDTYTVPAGVTQVTVECWGGGGRGGTRSSNGRGGGGGGGAYSRSTVTVTPGNTYTVTVGAGSNSTSSGGDSWFGSAATVMAKGGSSSGNNSTNGGNGGAAASGVGTVKFSGGDGADATGSATGGGGSSAGTAADGDDGGNSGGGNAPAGGGDGGNGRTGSQGDGSNGSVPGGGGGGGYRQSSGTRDGGNGADGKVVVTTAYNPATCMAVGSHNAIADNACGSRPLQVTLPVSGQPTTLGTAAGNARLSSVEFIIDHTYNSDLDITLTSPAGTTRNLVLDRFGNGDDFGNPANCPTAAFVLQDGATALTTTNTSNPTGPYQPENTLAGFTGDPNGNWVITICDDANADTGNLIYAKLNFCTVPSASNAGPDQTICATGSATLAANTPAHGTGAWSVVSGPSTSLAQFSNTAANNATFTPAGGAGAYVLRWTISSTGICTATTDNITVTAVASPTVSNAGPPQTICVSSGSAVMAANNPTTGVGAWTQVSGPVTASIANPAARNTSITGMTTAGAYVFRWTITNAPCSASTSDITVTANPAPTTASAGSNQTICSNPGSATMAGNTPSVGTGAWSQVSGPVTATIANTASPTTSITGMTTAGSYVFRWTISNAPCTASQSNVTITVNGAPTTADAGTDQTLCVLLGTATMAGNTPSVGTGAWSQVSGPVTASITTPASATTGITGLTTSGTYVFRWTITSLSPCAASQDDVSIVVSDCIYYSRANGNVGDAIWSLTPSGTAGSATFDQYSSMVVQNGNTVTNNANTVVNNLTVENGGTLVLGASNTLDANGNVTLTGSLTANDNSNLELSGSAATALNITGTKSFWDLTINTPSGTTLTGLVRIRGTLQLNDGAFAAGTGQVTLRSTATFTGRLGPVASGASYTGDMNVERYIPAGATNWRLVGSPVAGQTILNLKDDFFTAGFPGSHYPGFFDPPGSGIYWPSIRWYNETNTGAGQNDGLGGVSNTSQAMSTGQGFACWSGSGLTTTSAFTMDLQGAPTIASTPISLPMSYTNTGNPTVDGWNMVSNPLPSPIAFDQISRGANVEDYITYFDPATGNMATWDIGLGSGTNGGSNTIQSFQGFFLKANGSSVTTTVEEADKVAGNGGGFFGGMEVGPVAVRLQITSAINSFSDETMVVFSEGAPETNGDDVPKYVFAHPQAPQIASIGDNGELIAINAFGEYTTAISIPLSVNVGVTGTYTVAANGMEGLGLSCASIEDLVTGTITPLVPGASYSFSVDAAADPNVPRLLLHATAPLAFTANPALCSASNNGSVQVDVVNGPADIVWTNDLGATIATNAQANGTVQLSDLAPGDYTMTLTGVAGCGTMEKEFTITAPEALGLQASTSDASCPGSTDGAASVTVSGGTAPYAYAWSNGATSEQIAVGTGNYSVVVTDANGCTVESPVFTIESASAPEAVADAENTITLVNVPVVFINNSTPDMSYLWNFGDGETSTEAAPQHSYSLPGTYNVTLTVDNGECSATTTVVITVEVNTGVAEVNADKIAAWMNGDNLVVEHGFTDKYPLQLDVLNEAGQVYLQRRVAGPAGRLTIPATDLSSGVWYVRVTNDEVRRTIPVVIVR